MASQVHVANYPCSSFAGLPIKQEDNFQHTAIAEPELSEEIPLAAGDPTGKVPVPDIIAYGVEFVALPGKAEELHAALPEAMRNAFGNCGSFSGCMVFVSELEARLVTVITLWTGKDRAKQCSENSKRVERLLMPYVDRCLRTRRLAAFLSAR